MTSFAFLVIWKKKKDPLLLKPKVSRFYFEEATRKKRIKDYNILFFLLLTTAKNCLNLILLLASSSVTSTLPHVLLHYIYKPSSFPPSWQLHIQHPLRNISTMPPPHLLKPDLCLYFVSKLLDLSCPSDISNPVHPGLSQYKPEHLQLYHLSSASFLVPLFQIRTGFTSAF